MEEDIPFVTSNRTYNVISNRTPNVISNHSEISRVGVRGRDFSPFRGIRNDVPIPRHIEPR